MKSKIQLTAVSLALVLISMASAPRALSNQTRYHGGGRGGRTGIIRISKQVRFGEIPLKNGMYRGTPAGELFFGSKAGTTNTVQAGPPKTSGIYLTADDYKNGLLSYVGDCGSGSHKLELHDVLDKPYIDVTHEAEKHRYSKSELFGFRACDGRDYRFTSNLEYQILESKELFIYAREYTRSVLASAAGTQGNKLTEIREYFFSTGPIGPILALTPQNLKQAFPNNHRFHDSIDAEFSVNPVAEYDEFHKMFKVNRLLIASRE